MFYFIIGCNYLMISLLLLKEFFVYKYFFSQYKIIKCSYNISVILIKLAINFFSIKRFYYHKNFFQNHF